MKKCPFCAAQIEDDDLLCWFCRWDLIRKVSARNISEEVLERSVTSYRVDGWVLLSYANGVARLGNAKKFNYLLFFLLLPFFGIPALIYIIDYCVFRKRSSP